MYNSYAAIYDLAQQGRFSAHMAQWSLDWLAARKQRPTAVLDLACGTGAAALAFAQTGCAVTAIDLSAAMLSIAEAKARDQRLTVHFAVGDMRTWVPEQRFDLVTCFADSLNYLTGKGDLAHVFGTAAAALHPGGWLIFDMNTSAEYATWDERDLVAFDSADLLLYQKLRYNQRTRIGTGRIGWFVREIDHWWRGSETHQQRNWRSNEVEAALAGAGLCMVLAEPAPGAINGRRFVYVVQNVRIENQRTENQQTQH